MKVKLNSSPFNFQNKPNLPPTTFVYTSNSINRIKTAEGRGGANMTNQPNDTDGSLIESALFGDGEAFSRLVMRYQRVVFGAVYSVLRNKHLAEDIAQDALLAAWQKLGTLKETDKFGPWVYQVALNKAKDYFKKHRESISLEYIPYPVADNAYNPERVLFPGSFDQLHEVIEKLSEKLGIVIKLHYFESASIEEIAQQLNLSAGTVKWRLHEAREKIRKGMVTMSEQAKTTAAELLLEMAQIQERCNRSNGGFETDYKTMLAKINKMPDTPQMYYCLAEWLEQGANRLPLWKKPGTEEITEMAQKGKHTALLGRLMEKETENKYGGQLTEHIKTQLLPRMEKENMTESMGRMWLKIADAHRWDNEYDKSYEAYQKALEYLPAHSTDRAEALAMVNMCDLFKKYPYDWKKTRITAIGVPLVKRGTRMMVKNGTQSASNEDANPFIHAALCDSIMFDTRLKIGESITSRDGSVTLTYDSKTADGSAVWVTKGPNIHVSAYYQTGIGLTGIDILANGYKMQLALTSRTIAGGEGLLPLHTGNSWEYTDGRNPEHFALYNRYEVVSTQGNEAIIAAADYRHRLSYDPNSWNDTILHMRYNYHDGNDKLADVSDSMNRAAQLAATPYQKLHTQVATDVMGRIFKGDDKFTPEGDFSGHWNFFCTFKPFVYGNKILCTGGWGIYSFEWKKIDLSNAAYPLLGTFMMEMFKSAVGCFWCDDWKPGVKMLMEGINNKTVSEVTVEDAQTIQTPAGTFHNCLKISLDVKQNNRHTTDYFTGEKDYYFAPGVGIVRSVQHFEQGRIPTVYDLTAYTGTGEGYMPIDAGLYRCYEAQNLTGGYIGKVELTYCDDDHGVRTILENKTGIRKPRKTFSELDWDDNIIRLAQDYVDGDNLSDVSGIMKRLEEQADTPYRKLYTAAALDCMNRIFDGNLYHTKTNTFSGHWNFFSPRDITFWDNKIIYSEYDGTYSFEWKGINVSHDDCYALLGSDMLAFLQYAAACIWNDGWRAGTSHQAISDSWSNMTTDITVEPAGAIETAAGRFDNCLKVALNISGGIGSGYDHCTGKKDYYFAPAIGIVKLVNHFKEGKLLAVYELTAYEGTGEGYMPVNAGLFRRYEAVGLANGYVGTAEYTFCEDNSGQLRVIENRTGIRMFDAAITHCTPQIEAAPNNAELWENRAYLYRQAAQWEEALADYNKAIELDNTKTQYYMRRGWVLYEMGELDKALADYTHAVTTEPENNYAYNERSSVYWKMGRYADAIRDYNKSAELEPRRAGWNKKQVEERKRELAEKGIDAGVEFGG
jgi:RNA polymerase sigma-70 factor (ECF subfamily)